MRIGFDVDGVLANFCDAYETACIQAAEGKNLFQPWSLQDGPVTWNWPEHYGYTKEEVGRVWQMIKNSNHFWSDLTALPDMLVLERWLVKNWRANVIDEMYFVTSRPGINAKAQTEDWFLNKGNGIFATVLISDEKGLIAKGLNLDFYVDDKIENVESVIEHSPKTRVSLMDREYNRKAAHLDLYRISNLSQFLDSVEASRP